MSITARACMDGFAVTVQITVDDRTVTRMGADEARVLHARLTELLETDVPDLELKLDAAFAEAP